MPLRLIKFGGASITRNGCEGLFDRDNVRRIVHELGIGSQHCVIVHGTGLVGKRPAVEHGYLQTGRLAADDSLLGMRIRASLRELNRRVLDVLFEAGIPALPMDAWQCFNTGMDGLRHPPLAHSIRQATDQGLVPLFCGDFVPQPDGSFRVMSSDTMMLILARALQPDAALMLTAADGVYGQSELDPTCQGAVMPLLSKSNRFQMYKAASDKDDVSGGMGAKVDHAFEIAACSGGSCTIASGLVPGVLSAVMANEDVVCTRVVSEQKSIRKGISMVCLLLGLAMFTGCMSPMGKFAGGLGDGLGRVPDRTLAQEGIPACILMIEGALSGSPNDPDLLEAASGLYSFYGSYAVKDNVRAQRLTERALDYALRAADFGLPGMREARMIPFGALEALVTRAKASHVPSLFSVGSVWMDWIRVRADDMDAIGDLPRVELIMERVASLDAPYQAGAAYFYLALLSASLPDDNAVIAAHFTRAIEAAKGQSLMPEVFYAFWLRDHVSVERGEVLLKGIVDRGLPDVPARTLVNQMALDKAQQALSKMDSTQ